MDERLTRRLDAADVHRLLAGRWREVLVSLGVPEDFLSRRNVPCPACGGTDRFTFDDRQRHGDYFCRQHGNGDGFDLLMRAFGWDFNRALREVIAWIDAAGLRRNPPPLPVRSHMTPHTDPPAQPTQRVRDLLCTSCDPSDVLDVVRYLKSRHVWPLPRGCSLRAHVGVDYYEKDRRRIGRYPALVAPLVDFERALVTVHVTHLLRGAKLTGHEPRKKLSGTSGRLGCAVRLVPAAPVLGIAEGIETALAATRLHNVPTWAALDAGLLAKFVPPQGTRHLVIFADNDANGVGQKAAQTLRSRMAIPCEIRLPEETGTDWWDALASECHD
jgi:putative DNA primase/helicase